MGDTLSLLLLHICMALLCGILFDVVGLKGSVLILCGERYFETQHFSFSETSSPSYISGV